MMNILTILLIPVVLIAVWVVSLYNFFVTAKTRIKASIQEIGNQLKRQADLIPNLESSAKGYLAHEKDIFDKLTEARKAVQSAVKSGDTQKMADAGNLLNDVLPKLQVVVESNPEIQGAEVVKSLMDELRDTSDKLMYARRILIDLSADFNAKLVTFPTNIVAKLFGFKEEKGLATPEAGAHMEVSEAEVKSPKINI